MCHCNEENFLFFFLLNAKHFLIAPLPFPKKKKCSEKSISFAKYSNSFFLFMQSPVVKTETISFSSVSAGGDNLEISTKEVPVVHTETKTITYESSQVRNSAKARV